MEHRGRVEETCTHERSTGILQVVPIPAHQEVWFLHNGATAYFSILMRDHFHAIYPGKWIRRSGPVAWSPRSPDLNLFDFFFWDSLKSLQRRISWHGSSVLQLTSPPHWICFKVSNNN
ncbi:uncharacterized protein TNCV_3392011 [Trichonephila clavipes]|nr:uncharacterized protein TNCV_3392011 [Trichonephila clavipes]